MCVIKAHYAMMVEYKKIDAIFNRKRTEWSPEFPTLADLLWPVLKVCSSAIQPASFPTWANELDPSNPPAL